eukprot:TRINITY_DN888_c0_g2_i2.p1 TRINITY_DN888_c0_g2~~TRINITY_DN888_c0_g2_i2.p1  ORF type:complete len:223 (-),score=51.50 TRINITY_DN888_c0_g2_i2:424-993(-)
MAEQAFMFATHTKRAGEDQGTTVKKLKKGSRNLKTKVQRLKVSVAKGKTKVQRLKVSVAKGKTKVQRLKVSVAKGKTKVQRLKVIVAKLKQKLKEKPSGEAAPGKKLKKFKARQNRKRVATVFEKLLPLTAEVGDIYSLQTDYDTSEEAVAAGMKDMLTKAYSRGLAFDPGDWLPDKISKRIKKEAVEN